MRGRLLLVASLLGVASFTPARAIVIYGGTGTQNLTPPTTPTPNLGWNNVGSLNGATGVYLGNYNGGYWVATASHVGAGSITFSSGTYTAVGGSAINIQNPDHSATDLTLFRISTDPGLSTLSLATSAPATNSVVQLMGYGVVEGTYTRYDVSGNTWTVSSSDPYDREGYTQSASQGRRWGEAFVGGTADYSLSGVVSNGVYTVFSSVNGSSQGAVGDSGGAMFSYNGSTWELAGILSAIGTFDGQPGGTSVVGNTTFAVNLANYRSAILAAIPEPADVALVMGALFATAACWHRRRRA